MEKKPLSLGRSPTVKELYLLWDEAATSKIEEEGFLTPEHLGADVHLRIQFPKSPFSVSWSS